jgi:hypothetical protein
MRRAARLNFHMLALSNLAACRGIVAFMHATARPLCIIRARDFAMLEFALGNVLSVIILGVY